MTRVVTFLVHTGVLYTHSIRHTRICSNDTSEVKKIALFTLEARCGIEHLASALALAEPMQSTFHQVRMENSGTNYEKQRFF